MLSQLYIEVEPDEYGHHAVVIDVSDDCVLHVTNTYATLEDAEAAARQWIERNE